MNDLYYGTIPMVEMLVRGIYIGVMLVYSLFFGLIRESRQKYHICFAVACAYLLLSVLLGIVGRLAYHSMEITVFSLETLINLSSIPFFLTFVYCIIRQPGSWQPLVRLFLELMSPFIVGLASYMASCDAYLPHFLLLYSFVVVLYAGVRVIHAIRHYHRQLENSYAEDNHRRLDWFYRVIGMLVTYFFSFVFIEYLYADHYQGLVETVYLLLSLVLLSDVGHSIHTQSPVETEILDATDAEVAEVLPDSRAVQIDRLLRVRFEEPQAFTAPDINIRQTARLIGTNIHYLSIHLNQHRRQSYVQYVNQLRVDLACQILQTEDVTAEELAERTGFGASSTFFRIFKLQTGFTPGEYKERSHRGEEVVVNTPQTEVEAATDLPKEATGSEPRPLTKREQYLCELISQGLSNEEISERMHVSSRSLRVMRSRLRQKLNLERKDSLAKHLSMGKE